MEINEMIHLAPADRLWPGDFFLWESSMSGTREIHRYHSDVGYGIKTWTQYNPENGSSQVVSRSCIIGKLVPIDNPVSDFDRLVKK